MERNIQRLLRWIVDNFLMENYYVDIQVQQQISDLYGKISNEK